MFGFSNGWGQQGPGSREAGFCWHQHWAGPSAGGAGGGSHGPQAPQPAALPHARVDSVPGQPVGRADVFPLPTQPPLQLPLSRSGAALLSAQRAHQRKNGSAADPFDFEEPAQHKQQQVQPQAAAAGGWRGRNSNFLLSSAQAAAADQPPQQQHVARQWQTQAPAPPQAPPGTAAGNVVLPAATKPTAAGAAAAVASMAAVAGPAVTCPLPLDRYLDLWQLLTRGSGRVQALSDLEKSILKSTDLKQIMLVNGLQAGSRPKKELLDRMAALHLFSPLCLLPEGDAAACTGGTGGSDAGKDGFMQDGMWEPGVPELDAEVMRCLGWLEPGVEAGLQLGAQAGSRCGGGGGGCSCCALPSARICLLEGTQWAAAGEAAVDDARQQAAFLAALTPPGHTSAGAAATAPGRAQPADSDATFASLAAAACVHGAVLPSPEVNQQLASGQGGQRGHTKALEPPPGAAPTAQTAAVCLRGEHPEPAASTQSHAEEAGQNQPAVPEPPQWLVQGVASVAERSQGSADAVTSQQLLRRRVAFVLLEDFDQSDAHGITDTVEAGVLEGQVVEAVAGLDHDEDCPPGCTQAHAFHYVRLRATRSTALAPRQAARRLDLVLDLQPAFRRRHLDSLLGLGDEELQDAWVLLEPRQDAEPQARQHPAGTTATTVAAGLTRGNGGGSSKSRSRPAATGAKGRGRAGHTAVPAALGGDGWRSKRGATPAAMPGAKRQQHTTGGVSL